MIIDAHNHPNYLNMNCEKILANMKEHNIDQTWLLTLETPRFEYAPEYYRLTRGSDAGPITFEQALACKDKAPDQFILGYAPDPRQPYALEKLEAAIEMYDVKVFGEVMLRMMYDNPDATEVFRYCGTRQLPVIVEVNYGLGTGGPYAKPGYWYGGGIDAFSRALQQCPETIFLGHGPGFWAHFSNDDLYLEHTYPTGPIVPNGKVIQMMREHLNLYCDLSAGSGLTALKRDLEFTKAFLIEYQDRILFGRDQWDGQLQQLLNDLQLPNDVLEKIFSLNAQRLIR